MFECECEKECTVCQLKFSSDFSLQRHHLALHPLSNPITCCSQAFKPDDNKRHKSSTHPVLIECSECGKQLKSKKTFLIHKRTHQDVADRRFKCSIPNCSKAFNFKVHLENHERIHSGEKSFKCSMCPASFKQKYQLKTHEKKHDESSQRLKKQKNE